MADVTHKRHIMEIITKEGGLKHVAVVHISSPVSEKVKVFKSWNEFP